MPETSLETFVRAVRSAWGPLTTELVEDCRAALAQLLLASPTEAWLAELHATAPASRELYRDPDHGFVLLAHTEPAGLYRPPHDHGRAWVLYGMQRGEIEMRTYGRVVDPDNAARLVRRETGRLTAGLAQAYLPGDIHDTRCVSAAAVLFRFTARDLRHEDRVEGRVTRYVERNGAWVAPNS